MLATETRLRKFQALYYIGVNACKGESESSSAKKGCKGQNDCEGEDWLSMGANVRQRTTMWKKAEAY